MSTQNSPMLCTERLRDYLNRMAQDIITFHKNEPDNATQLVKLLNYFTDFATLVEMYHDERVLQYVNDMRSTWTNFCDEIDKYGITEPLCNEKFNPGSNFNICCFGEPPCEKFDTVLGHLLLLLSQHWQQ